MLGSCVDADSSLWGLKLAVLAAVMATEKVE